MYVVRMHCKEPVPRRNPDGRQQGITAAGWGYPPPCFCIWSLIFLMVPAGPW